MTIGMDIDRIRGKTFLFLKKSTKESEYCITPPLLSYMSGEKMMGIRKNPLWFSYSEFIRKRSGTVNQMVNFRIIMII